MDYKNKKIVIADLDGTLAESKSRMDVEMADIITHLLQFKSFAVISGGMFSQFQRQFVGALNQDRGNFGHLYLFPTCATAFYRFENNGWTKVYSEDLSDAQKIEIRNAFGLALVESGFEMPEKLYGELIEDRGTQVTFSAIGQHAPTELKRVWDPDGNKRLEIIRIMKRILPGFDINIGGMTSIDVTKKGIDKAYGIEKIRDILGFGISEMLFIGDALFEGGNDYPVKRIGVDCVAVSGPADTKEVLRTIIAESV